MPYDELPENITTTPSGTVPTYFGDTPSIDAFNRLRVSNPTGLFDYQAQYDAGSLLWEDDLTGAATATHNANKSSVDLAVTTASGDKVIRQTRQYHRYQPGKSQLVLVTFQMAAAATNLRQRVGYFDGENGIFLELEGSTLNIVRRSYATGSAVDTEVAQASWNVDAFDGTGTSGITLDITKSQILAIDMEWLGVGRVRCGFVVDGIIKPFHQFTHANESASVYMTTANLPVRYEIEATGALSSSATLMAICASVISEGGFETARGVPFCKATGTTLNAVTTREPILSIRPKATFNSVVNRGTIIPFLVEGYAEDNGCLFEVVYNGSLTGASFSSVDGDSIVEADTSATAISGGHAINAFYVPASAQGNNQNPNASSTTLLSRLPLTLDIAGSNPIPLTLVATSLNATTNVAGNFCWQELR